MFGIVNFIFCELLCFLNVLKRKKDKYTCHSISLFLGPPSSQISFCLNIGGPISNISVPFRVWNRCLNKSYSQKVRLLVRRTPFEFYIARRPNLLLFFFWASSNFPPYKQGQQHALLFILLFSFLFSHDEIIIRQKRGKYINTAR